jgi:hypothetical protein
MRQHRWLEVLKDYDNKMFYHPAKANVVVDVLSKKSHDGEIDPEMLMEQLAQQFLIVQIDEVLTDGPPIMAALVVKPLCVEWIRQAQENDLELQNLVDSVRRGEASRFYLPKGGMLKTRSGKTGIPNDVKFIREILDEAMMWSFVYKNISIIKLPLAIVRILIG